MLTLRRKITGALGGGSGSAVSGASSSSPCPQVASPRALPPPLSISHSSLSTSPQVPSQLMRVPSPSPSAARAALASSMNIGSPRAASPAVQASPLHEHQPLAPRRTSVAWVPDSLAENCYACHAAFSLILLRRHHCRRCGNVFCDACSQGRVPLVSAGHLTPVRVCDKCGVAAKKAHARIVGDRQRAAEREQQATQQRRRQLRSLRSDDQIAYDENVLFPPPRAKSSSSSSSSSIRRLGGKPPHGSTAVMAAAAVAVHGTRQSFLRSQTVRTLVPNNHATANGMNGSAKFFPDVYEEDEEERRSFERRSGLGDAANNSNEVSVHTLPGEVLLVRSENVLCRLMNLATETVGTLYVTSFRLVFSPVVADVPEYEDEGNRPAAQAHQAVPLGTIERLKRKEKSDTDSGLLDIVTKDFRHVQFTFQGLVAKQTFNQFDLTVCSIKQYAFGEPLAPAEPFVRCMATATAAAMDTPLEFDGWSVYDAAAEFQRMGVGSNAVAATPRWRLTPINDEYDLCATYPKLLAVPASVGDQVLAVAAKYRSKSRIPVLSWRDTRTGAVICRSSQPLVGLGQRQCDKDVFLIQAIAVANPSSSKLVIIDARPWKNAVAQKTVGSAGYELTEHYETRHSSATTKFADLAASSTDFGGKGASSVLPSPPSLGLGLFGNSDTSYEDEDDGSSSSVSDRIFRQADGSAIDPALILTECKLIFMGIENIHTMRRSYNKLLDLCIHKPTDKWVEHLGSTRWIEHISKILDSAVEIVRIVNEQKCSVLVHCSDGWDRTPQLTSLAQLLMDPYYRTITGFQVLIEKEWCSFGHKFRDRSAHGMNPSTSSDISPVFLQFIDCVWQVCRQFPCSFEFNEQYLILILDHLYSCRFGTFMFDCEKERREKEAAQKTISLWTYVASLNRTDITNPFYTPPRKTNAVSLGAVSQLLDPAQTQVGASNLDELISAALPPNAELRDKRVEDESEAHDDAFNLFPQAPPGGATSAPIRIPVHPTPEYPMPSSPELLFPSANQIQTSGSNNSWSSSSEADASLLCATEVRQSMPVCGTFIEEVDEDEVLLPCAWSRALQFWSRYYLRWDPSSFADRLGSVWVEAAHRELQYRLAEAERQLQQQADDQAQADLLVTSPKPSDESSKCAGSESPQPATLPRDTIEKLEAIELRRREALARVEKEFEEEAAKLLQPAASAAS